MREGKNVGIDLNVMHFIHSKADKYPCIGSPIFGTSGNARTVKVEKVTAQKIATSY